MLTLKNVCILRQSILSKHKKSPLNHSFCCTFITKPHLFYGFYAKLREPSPIKHKAKVGDFMLWKWLGLTHKNHSNLRALIIVNVSKISRRLIAAYSFHIHWALWLMRPVAHWNRRYFDSVKNKYFLHQLNSFENLSTKLAQGADLFGEWSILKKLKPCINRALINYLAEAVNL